MYGKWNPVEYSSGCVFDPLMLVVTKGDNYIVKQIVEDLLNMYDKKREREIEHMYLLIYLER